MIAFRQRLLYAACALALSACAGAPTPARETQAPVSFELSGRLAVRHAEEHFSGHIRWRHTSTEDDILLSTPLGQGVARLGRDAQGVTLLTSDRKRYAAADPEALTEKVLGWRLPLAGLSHWVTGRPAPSSPAVVSADRLTQQGWQIDFSDRREIGRFRLPARITLERGELHIRLVVDRWQARG